MTTSTHLLPRRRSPRHADQASLGIGIKPCSTGSAMSLRKGATFHTPTSPSSSTDPTLHIRGLPSRALTSPKDLEDLVTESQKRVEEIIKVFDRSLSLSGEPSRGISLQDVLPVPSVFLAHTASNKAFLDAAGKKAASKTSSRKQSTIGRSQTEHDHASDSGLGSSIDSSVYEEALSPERSRGSMSPTGFYKPASPANTAQDVNTSTPATNLTSVYTPSRTFSAAKKSFSSDRRDHFLDDFATTQIQKHVVDPLLEVDTLKEYHPLVEDLPNRIASKKITCLRDLEKTLIFLAEVSTDFSDGEGALAYCFLRIKFKAKSSASYFEFCNIVIQCVYTAANHLNEIDQRRPTDRPYTNTYFIDLVEQVRQYARIMAITRQKQAQGKALDEMDHKPFVTPNAQSYAERLLTSIRDEKLKLSLQEGKPAELIRERADGTTIPIEGGHMPGSAVADDSIIDADMERSMARKRKCDIGKVEYRTCRECEQIFTRACDLTKHEKTHSRPWKCPESDCKYHTDGWPTEKERDRHVNDKHMRDAPLFKCLFQPCAYSSKRESNCKQHMEKAHGWEYVRAKSKKGQKLIPSTPAAKLPTEMLPTPNSDTAFPSLSTPDTTTMSNSPNILSDSSYSPNSDFESIDDSYMHGDVTTLLDPYASAMGHSIMDSHLTVQQDLTLDTSMSYDGPLFTSPDCPDLLNTPGTGYTHSPSNPAVPSTDDFEFNFNVDGNSPGWQRMQSYFPQWFDNNTTTPYGSNGDAASMNGGEHQLTYPDYGNTYQNKSSTDDYGAFTIAGAQQQFLQGHAMPTYFPVQNQPAAPSDFTLFLNGNGYGNGQSSNSGPLFPAIELGAVGGQFNAAEESIYDEPMETEDKMMEQFMNFDDDADEA